MPLPEEVASSLDDDVDDFLAEAGIPLRPRGYRWYLLAPSALRGRDTSNYVNEWISTHRPDVRMPRETRAAIEGALDDLYRPGRR